MFEYTLAMPFFPPHWGSILATSQQQGSFFFNLKAQFFDKTGLFWAFDHQYFIFSQYWRQKVRLLPKMDHLSPVELETDHLSPR